VKCIINIPPSFLCANLSTNTTKENHRRLCKKATLYRRGIW